MPLTEVSTSIGLGLVAVPEGTQIGDGAAIVTSGSISATLGQGADQFPTVIPAPGGDPGAKFFLGQIATLDPIEINVETGGPGLPTYSAHAQIITLRGLLLPNTVATGSSAGDPPPPAVMDPVGNLAGAIVLSAFHSGIGGSSGELVADGGADWTGAGGDAAYHGVESWWTPGPVTSMVSVGNLGANEGWISALLVGVRTRRGTPPCQLHPADTLGSVGGSGGHRPWSRSRQRGDRIAGGYY